MGKNHFPRNKKMQNSARVNEKTLCRSDVSCHNLGGRGAVLNYSTVNPPLPAQCFFFLVTPLMPVTQTFLNFVTGTFDFSRAYRKLSRARPKFSREFFSQIFTGILKNSFHGHFYVFHGHFCVLISAFFTLQLSQQRR